MNRQIQFTLLASCMAAALGLGVPSYAQVALESDKNASFQSQAVAIGSSLSLSDAIKQTLVHSPKLAIYPHELRIAEAQIIQSGITPNPRLSLNIDNVLGTGAMSGISGAETSLRLSQLIELGDKRQHRMALTQAKQQNLNAEFELARVQVLADVTQDYYEVLRLSSLVDLKAKCVELEAQALAKSQLLAKAGAVSQADVAKLALVLANSELATQALQSQLQQAKLALAMNWLGNETIGSLTESLTSPLDYPDLAQVLSAIDRAPEYLVLASQQGVVNAQLGLAQAKATADLDISAGIKRSELSDDTGLLLSVSMPLTLTNPNEGNILAARIEQQKQQDSQRIYRQQLSAKLSQLYVAMDASAKQAQMIESQTLPLAKQLLIETQMAYEAGQANVLQLVDAQSQLFSLEQSWIQAKYQAFSQLLTLERLTGQALVSETR